MIGRKGRIPIDGHPPRKDLMGGVPWGSPGVLCDGEKMMFPMITAPQAPESIGDANQSRGAHDWWELMAGEWVPQVQCRVPRVG